MNLRDIISGFAKERGFSDQEIEILLRLLSGMSVEDIAAQLQIEPKVIHSSCVVMLKESGMKSMAEMLAMFLKIGVKDALHCRLFAIRPRILVVDDEPDVCEILTRDLRDRGMETFSETNPKKSLEDIPRLHVDFILSDIRMPHLDGFHLLKETKRLPTHPVFFFMTGDSPYSVNEYLEAGAAGVFNKPMDLDKMFVAIMEHFIDSEYENDRLFRTPVESALIHEIRVRDTPTVSDAFRIANIGFGGLFIAFENESTTVDVGDTVELSFSLASKTTPIAALGEVVWRRRTIEGKKPAGVGVKFKKLRPADREQVFEFLRLKRISGFIPKGVLK